jgi:hypothetical protein
MLQPLLVAAAALVYQVRRLIQTSGIAGRRRFRAPCRPDPEGGIGMRRHAAFTVAALLALVAGLAACDALSTLVDGWKYAQAVETDLEASIGMKPEVGFNWRNGRLEKVTVAFPRLYEAKPLPEFVEIVRRVVGNRFKQTPDDIVLCFSLGKSPPGKTVGLSDAD